MFQLGIRNYIRNLGIIIGCKTQLSDSKKHLNNMLIQRKTIKLGQDSGNILSVRFHELEIDITVEKRWNLKESDRDLEGSRKFSGRFHGRN